MHLEASSLLDVDDLISDHEIKTAEGDRLAHSRIAQQLAMLVGQVPDRSNIALYGSWGSGKSSVANLLRSALDEQRTSSDTFAGRVTRKKRIMFARFDAFKYAETPLRRNFISAVARDLGVSDQRFHSDLYAGSTSTEVKVDGKKSLAVFKTFVAILTILAAVVASLVGILAWVRADGWWPFWHSWWTSFRELTGPIAVSGLVPTALLSGLVALATRSFNVERKSDRPESDEQFEDLFRALVQEAKADRLVVFVDELDRCPANTVATTLDTIRTFFGVGQCVFVVAADRQVLEVALTRAEDVQETPQDTVNPYYSTGSAYLDKVFQYQVSLPPLLPHRVSKFALDLLDGKRGVWAEINARFVVSVLVPSHVTSPRRVKHLLNTFALTYRLADDRFRQGLLAEKPGAEAVARLVCLSVEFPLFARDLEIDARLPQHILALLADSESIAPAGVSDRAWGKAREYAEQKALVASVLTEDDQAALDGEETAEVGQQHAQQLLDYLVRTRDVQGPSRDLVYLHSAGTTFGLDGELAISIERAAEDGKTDQISSRISGLDPSQQAAALALLVEQIKTGIGVGATNAARVLLGVIGQNRTLPLDTVADDAAAAVSHVHHTTPGFLDPATAAQAWALAKHGTETGAQVLRHAVMEAATESGWEEHAGFLLDDPEQALGTDPDRFGNLVSRVVVSAAAGKEVARLSALTEPVLDRVLEVSAEHIRKQLKAALDIRTAWEDANEAAEEEAAQSAQSAVDPGEDVIGDFEPLDIADCISALADLAADRAHSAPRITRTLFMILLDLDTSAGRGAVESKLDEIPPAQDCEFIARLLKHSGRRAEEAKWYCAIDPGSIQTAHADLLHERARWLWKKSIRSNDPIDARAALSAIEPLHAALAMDRRLDLTDAVLAELEDPFSDTSAAERAQGVLACVPAFVAAGFVHESQLAFHICEAASTALTESRAALPSEDPLVAFLSEVVTAELRILADASHTELGHLAVTLTANLERCVWLQDITRASLSLSWAKASRVDDVDLAMPGHQVISNLLISHGASVHPLTLKWIVVTQPSLDDFRLIFEQLRGQAVASSSSLADAVDAVRHSWSEAEQVKFLRDELGDTAEAVPNRNTLRILGLSKITDSVVGDVLIERFSRCTTNSQRHAVISLWEAAEISDDLTRRRLIENIILSMLSTGERGAVNKGSVEHALSALPKVAYPLPRGTKRALGQAIRGAVAGDQSLEAKATPVATALGYRIENGGLFGRKKRVNYDAD